MTASQLLLCLYKLLLLKVNRFLCIISMIRRDTLFVEWSAMAPANENRLIFGTTEVESNEAKPEEKEPERDAPLTITPLGNSYYGSQSSLDEDQKIPGSPDTPIGE